MNRVICTREEQTSAGIRNGVIDHETESHAQGCPACTETLLVSRFLLEDVASARRECRVPDAELIWRNARLRADREATRLALRPIRFMTVLACLAFVCSPWLRLLLPVSKELAGAWSRTLDLGLAFVSKIWLSTATEAALLLSASATMILLGLSSWYVLRQE